MDSLPGRLFAENRSGCSDHNRLCDQGRRAFQFSNLINRFDKTEIKTILISFPALQKASEKRGGDEEPLQVIGQIRGGQEADVAKLSDCLCGADQFGGWHGTDERVYVELIPTSLSGEEQPSRSGNCRLLSGASLRIHDDRSFREHPPQHEDWKSDVSLPQFLIDYNW